MRSAYKHTKDVFRGSSSAWTKKLINWLTCVFEEREGEGVVSQRPQEVRDVASLPEELVRRWHVGRVKGCGTKTKTIDSNLRKKPDSSGTSTGVNFLWVRVCCRLLVTFSNNFAVGHITGTAACVQTTCMLISAETEPSGIRQGWRHWAAQPSVKTTRPMTREGAGRLRHNHNKPLVRREHIFPPRTTARAEQRSQVVSQHNTRSKGRR